MESLDNKLHSLSAVCLSFFELSIRFLLHSASKLTFVPGNLFLAKINNEKQYIKDISLIKNKLSVYEGKLINLQVDINNLKLKIKNEQNLLLTLLILDLSSNYIEFERVIKQTYVNLIKINI